MKKNLLILLTILLSALLVVCSESENDAEEVPEINDLTLVESFHVFRNKLC